MAERQMSRKTTTNKMIMPNDRWRLINPSGFVSRSISGIVQAIENCTMSSATVSQCKNFATMSYSGSPAVPFLSITLTARRRPARAFAAP